ncbi:MAG: hypothetical protein Ct9H300mP2_1880 [Candidatus Neomarinimicrobiota bacterium]|nr:MAG: hypothetical protein Ct9H300mP2_1880 [Candidatus Neomarinimicrobiota bacterium]
MDENNLGGATYSRLKRTTGYTFQDVRFFGHIFKKDQDIRVRYKFSEISLNLPDSITSPQYPSKEIVW